MPLRKENNYAEIILLPLFSTDAGLQDAITRDSAILTSLPFALYGIFYCPKAIIFLFKGFGGISSQIRRR